jgi:hypothetical protein
MHPNAPYLSIYSGYFNIYSVYVNGLINLSYALGELWGHRFLTYTYLLPNPLRQADLTNLNLIPQPMGTKFEKLPAPDKIDFKKLRLNRTIEQDNLSL